jgi:hypothetical protein
MPSNGNPILPRIDRRKIFLYNNSMKILYKARFLLCWILKVMKVDTQLPKMVECGVIAVRDTCGPQLTQKVIKELAYK